MSNLLEEENGQVRRRQRKLEQQRLLEDLSEPENGSSALTGSTSQSKQKSKRNGKPDRGKAYEKAQHELVRKRRQTSKLELKNKKIKTINDRKKTLAKVSLFAILAMHKMDKRLIHLASTSVRECLLLMFVHHLILRGETVRRLVFGKLGERTIPINEVPVVDYNSFNRQNSLQSNSPATLDGKNSSVNPNTSKDLSTSLKATETVESRSKEDKVLSSWLKWAVKTFASSLKISTDDSAFLKVVRSVDHHVDKLLNPDDDAKSNSKKSYRARMAWKYTAGGVNKRRLYPLLFNPQPLKRLFTTFAKTAEHLVVQAMEDGSFKTEQNSPNEPPVMTSMELNDSRAHDNGRTSSGNKSSLRSMKNIVSKTFNDSTRSLSTKAVSATSFEKSVLDPSMVIPEIDKLIARDVERMNDPRASTSQHAFMNDLAERMSHLPTRLAANLKLVATHTLEIDTSNDSPSLSVPHSVPVLSLESPWSLPSAQTPNTMGSIATPSQPDKELDEWTSSDSEKEIDCQSCPKHFNSLGGSGGIPNIQESELDLITPETRTDDNLMNISPLLTGREFFELVPMHTILIWEVIILLLQSGAWDCGFEEVIRQTAISLDIDTDLFDALVAYAADLVAEAVANELKTAFSTTDAPSETGSPATSDASPPLNTSESRTLATTTSNTLRVHGSINKERVLRIAGMALGIGALSALTAGLAAPAFAAGFGALGIAGTSGIATFLGSAGGAASLASLFGASSASLSGWKYSRRLADIRVFEFVHLSMNCIMDAIASFVGDVMDEPYVPSLGTSHLLSKSNPSVSQRTLKPPFGIVIGISGWLNSIEDATRPWCFLADRLGTELFALKWEPQLLTELGTMMIRLVGENVAYSAASLSVQMTMAASAGLIMWPVSLLQYAGQLDNTWMTCRERAQQAGYLLALALCDTSLVGHRPVTLIGYSVGSRVITYCLRELYHRGEYNRVKDVVMMGLPGSKVREVWRKMRSVVSGRLINVYCTSDWILAFLYRWMEWGVQVAGLSAIDDVPGVENFDATAIVVSHNNYEKRIPEILSLLNVHTSLLNKDDIISIGCKADAQLKPKTENQLLQNKG